MNRRYITALASVLVFVSLSSLLFMAVNALGIIRFSQSEKIFTGVLVVLSGYIAAVLTAVNTQSDTRRKKILRRQLFFIFIFYIMMLIDFTLIDDTMGRNIFNVFSWNSDSFREYINTSTNLVPFNTLRLFINGYKKGSLTFLYCVKNILGNIILFMPLPFFITCLFKHFGKWYTVLTAVLLSVLSVELLQLLFLTGASDIDDVILNVSGAMLIYGILKIKPVSRFISKITFDVWETDERS